jgi:hypothetical protein
MAAALFKEPEGVDKTCLDAGVKTGSLFGCESVVSGVIFGPGEIALLMSDV